MRQLLILWTVLGCAYLAFQVWHLPLRGPLDAQEVHAKLDTLLQETGRTEPVPQVALDFFLQDDGEPFYLVLLDRYGAQDDATAMQTKVRRQVLPQMLWRGSYPMFSWDSLAIFENGVAQDTAQFDRVTIVRYRSRRDLLELMSSPEIRASAAYRMASLEHSLAAPSARGPALNLEAFLPVLLMLIGLVVTLRTVASRAQSRLA